MNTYGMIYLALSFMGLGIEMQRHGKAKEGTYSFWSSLVAAAITTYLLYKAGAFH
jgi:hypothetical protein